MDGCGWGDCLDCHFEASARGSGSGRGRMRSSVCAGVVVDSRSR